MAQPPEKKKSAIVFWLGCLTVFFLAGLIAVGAGMFYMARRDFGGGRQGRGLSPLPASWRDSIRAALTAPPEGALLAPARTEPGNAAESLEAAPVMRSALALRRLERDVPLQAEDSAAMAEARSDSTLDALVRMARMSEYRALDLQLRMRGGTEKVYDVEVPSMWGVGIGAIDGLRLRAMVRLRDRNFAGAEADARAVIGLGLMVLQRSASWFGARGGRTRIASGAAILAQAAAARRDTATAGAARRLAAWAGETREGPSLMFLVLAYPDSALALAADSTAPFPARAHALVSGAIGSTISGVGDAIRGPRADVVRQVRALRGSPDAELARLAAAVDTALARIDDAGMIGRLRWTFRRMER